MNYRISALTFSRPRDYIKRDAVQGEPWSMSMKPTSGEKTCWHASDSKARLARRTSCHTRVSLSYPGIEREPRCGTSIPEHQATRGGRPYSPIEVLA
jgi:hypothetical protein